MKKNRKHLYVNMMLVAIAGLATMIWVNRSENSPSTTISEVSKPAGARKTQIVGNAGTPAYTVPAVPASTVAHQMISRVAGQAVDYPGAFAKAVIVANGGNYELTPNQLGYFERINVGPKSQSKVQVSFPEGQTGDKVAIVVEDGGHINDGKMSAVATLDDQKNLVFNFVTTEQKGIYRIALHSGADVKVVNFWVGTETPVNQ